MSRLGQFFTWLRGWGGVLAVIFAGGALIVSGLAYKVTLEAQRDTRAITGLDRRPVLAFDAFFRKFDDHPPSHYTVSNIGSVAAIHLEILPITHRYNSSDRDFQVSSYDGRQIIVELRPLKSETFEFSEHFLNVNARLAEPPEHNILEIRLTYRHPSDMREFVESAFYFVNPDGFWVKENSQSLTPEVYGPIKEAALKFAKRMYFSNPSDPLHTIAPKE